MLHIFDADIHDILISHLVFGLLDDASNQASGHGPATLTDVEALALLDGNRLVDLADHLDVVTGHDHLGVSVLGAFGPVNSGSLVCKTC